MQVVELAECEFFWRGEFKIGLEIVSQTRWFGPHTFDVLVERLFVCCILQLWDLFDKLLIWIYFGQKHCSSVGFSTLHT